MQTWHWLLAIPACALALQAAAREPAGSHREAAGIPPRARTAAHDAKVAQEKLGFRGAALEELARQILLLRERLYRVESARDAEQAEAAAGLLESHAARLATLWEEALAEAEASPAVQERIRAAEPRFDQVSQGLREILSTADLGQRAAHAQRLRLQLTDEDPRGRDYRQMRPTVFLIEPDASPPKTRERTILREGHGRTAVTTTVPQR